MAAQSHEAMEMYLETILVLLERNDGIVRSVDIAEEMGYSKPTVSERMKKLRADNYVNVDESGHVTLTDKGREIAENIYERHRVIGEIFVGLGVTPEVAHEDACRVEHYISQETFDCMKRHYEAHRGEVATKA